MKDIVDLIVRMALENRSWGYTRIKGALGIVSPQRTSWTVEVLTLRGLVTHYLLFFIDIATRSVHIAGTTTNPILHG
jgi:putative transposase